MDIRDVILIATGILDLILGILVLLRNYKNQTYVSFTLFSFSLAGWALGVAFFRLSSTIELSLFWAKIYYISASFIAASLLYFTSIFPEGKTLSRNRKLLIFIPAFVHMLLLSIPGYLTHSVVIYPWGKEIVLGKTEYLIYTLYFLPFFYGALYILWSKYKKAMGIVKKQILLVFVSILVASVFGVIFNLFLPWLGNYSLIYLGPPFTVIIFWIIAYAIIRHKMWDFRIVFARVIAHALLILVVAGAYSIFVFASSTFFLANEFSKTGQYIASGILIFIIALAFQPLRNLLEKITDKLFFQGRYDTNTLLSMFSHIMSTNIELRPLISQTLQTILKEMRIAKGALILKADGDRYEIISEGFKEQLTNLNCSFTFSLDMHRIVVFDDLEEGALKESMRDLDISIAKVLHVNEDIIGFLILGEKASGEMYSEQDLKVFDILSPELSVAIQNAQSFDKIKRFNITLENEVKNATGDLQKANSRLKELDLLKDDFVSVASHELRTPMTAIRSYLWMVLKRPDIKLSEKMEKYLSRAYISTERLINLVNDMLNVSRIESGSIEIRPKEFDIQSLVGEIVSMVLPKASEKNIKINIIKSKIPTVFADPDKVTQVVLNLLGNSLKFAPTDGKISISFFTDGKVVEVSIHDNGVGISKDDLSKLFQKFGRLDNSYAAAATSGGTGLGLYISKSLIELMHGKIWAISEGTGKGATFTFSLLVLTPELLVESEKYFKKPIGEVKELEQVSI